LRYFLFPDGFFGFCGLKFQALPIPRHTRLAGVTNDPGKVNVFHVNALIAARQFRVKPDLAFKDV